MGLVLVLIIYFVRLAAVNKHITVIVYICSHLQEEAIILKLVGRCV